MTANVTMKFVLIYAVPMSELERAANGITQALRDGALSELPPRRRNRRNRVMSELIAPPYAPPAASPYSPGLLTADWIFLSGLDPDSGELVSDDVACLVHLSDLAKFAEFNASYAKQFPGPVKPARTTVGSDLAAGMRVELTVVARRPGRAASAVTPAGR
jgi:enamine deaminase RidA (YjgF/YER057c/UK114 family)